MSENIAQYLRVTMPDGSKWDVPICVIAADRAKNYASEFNGDVCKSLEEDTIPLFEESPFEIEDWAANNMDWKDVADVALKVENEVKAVDYQEGWVNGEKEIVKR